MSRRLAFAVPSLTSSEQLVSERKSSALTGKFTIDASPVVIGLEAPLWVA